MSGLLNALVEAKIKGEKDKANENAKIQANIQAASSGAKALAQQTGDQSIVDNIHAMLFSQTDKGDVKPIPQTVESSKAALELVTSGLTMAQKVKQNIAYNQQKTMMSEGMQPVTQNTPVASGTPTTNVGGTDYADIPGFESPHQDTIINQAIQRISSARGDASLVRTELQRDAASQGYNTLTKAESEKRPLSQLEYYDTLGQMWRAKTGTAPTVESMASIEGKTLEQKLNNFGTFITGKPMSANSPEIISNLKNYIQDTGEQLDRTHDAYMTPHLIKPPGISDSAWAPIVSSARGLSFKKATDLVTIKSNTGKIKRVSREQAKAMGAL